MKHHYFFELFMLNSFDTFFKLILQYKKDYLANSTINVGILAYQYY